MKRVVAFLFALLPFAASAATLDQLNLLAQSQFRALSEDLGAATSYKALTPAEPLGAAGFDIGLEVTATELQSVTVWELASSEDIPDTVYIPKLHLHLGLPLGFDIGVSYSTIVDTDVDFWGAEVRYAIVEGSAAVPAIGIRGTYSKISGIDQLDFETRGLELTISKGIGFFTPYAGAGKIWVDSKPKNVPTLESEEFSLNRYYVGANFNFGIINLAVEGDKTGDATSYGLKLGWRF